MPPVLKREPIGSARVEQDPIPLHGKAGAAFEIIGHPDRPSAFPTLARVAGHRRSQKAAWAQINKRPRATTKSPAGPPDPTRPVANSH